MAVTLVEQYTKFFTTQVHTINTSSNRVKTIEQSVAGLTYAIKEYVANPIFNSTRNIKRKRTHASC